jgi:TonB family protein
LAVDYIIPLIKNISRRLRKHSFSTIFSKKRILAEQLYLESPKDSTDLIVTATAIQSPASMRYDLRFIFLIIFFLPAFLMAQPSSTPVFITAEQMPIYPGGWTALNRRLSETLHYPDSAISNRIEGRVFISFVIDTTGTITNVKILKGIGGGCDQEAARVIQSMPAWQPGRHHGQAVRVQLTLPITFQLPPVQRKVADTTVVEQVYTLVEQMPEFKGGQAAFDRFVAKRFTYPPQALAEKREGEVLLSTIVEENGILTEIGIVRGIGGGCEEEAVRILRSSPPWQPGVQNRKKVPVKLVLAFSFKLPK